MSTPVQYQFRIRSTDDTADDLVISSVPSADYPYIAEPPKGDGSTLDPLTGQVSIGAYTVQVIDALVSNVTTDLLAASEGFETYVNTAALLAAWTETDPNSLLTVTLDATNPDTGTKAMKLAKASSGGSFTGDAYATHTFTGLNSGALHRVTARCWLDSDTNLFFNFVGLRVDSQIVDMPTIGAIGAYLTLSLEVAANGSGEIDLDLGFFNLSPSQAFTRTAYFDTITIEEIGAGLGEGRIVTSHLTDAQGQQHLLSRKAYLEESTDLGFTWTVLTAGYINRYALVDAIRWEFSVGESRRIEQSHYLFERTSDPTEFPDLIGKMDRACCIVGGPIVGDFGPWPDKGRPLYEVSNVTGQTVTLDWISGYVSSPYREKGPPLTDNVAAFLNKAVNDYVAPDSAVAYQSGVLQTPCPGMVGRIYDAGDGTWVSDHGVMAVRPTGGWYGSTTDLWLAVNKRAQVRFAWVGTLPSVGNRFKLAMFPSVISERNPLHLTGHPMDLLGWWLTLAGVAFNEASRLAVRAELGDDFVVEYRPTARMTAKEACEQYIYGPFGVAPRLRDDGTFEFFRTRDPAAASVGLLTIDDLSSDSGTAFSNEEAKAANKVTFKYQGFNANDEKTDSSAFDAIRVSHPTITVDAIDTTGTAVFGDREIQWEIPGCIRGLASGTKENPGPLDLWIASQAQPLFDWQGRGSVEGEFHVLRGLDVAKIGQIFTYQFLHVPSASPDQTPTSQRGTVQRRAIALRRTRVPEGSAYLLQDRGPSDIPVTPDPYVPNFECPAIDPITALAATVVGLAVTLTWTGGADDVPLEISYREATDTDPIAVLTLPAGSLTATITLPDAATEYTFSVRYREDAPSVCVSDAVEINATTDVIATLSAPIDPAAFADGAGTYGMSCTPTVVDAAVEVWVAVETAVGSATAGAYTLSDSTASVTPRTTFTVPGLAPNDGLLRFLKARHTKTGWTPSAYTTPVSINPWTHVPDTDPVPPPDPTGDPSGGLASTIYEIVGHRTGPIEWRIAGPSAGRTILAPEFSVEDWYDFGAADVLVRITYSIPESTCPVGASLGWDYKDADGVWQDLGPSIGIDPTTITDADEDGVMYSEWFAIPDDAHANVRIRPVKFGGDDTGLCYMTGIALQGRAQAPDLPPGDPTSPPANEVPVTATQYVEQGEAGDGEVAVGFWQSFAVEAVPTAGGEVTLRIGYFNARFTAYTRVGYFDHARILDADDVSLWSDGFEYADLAALLAGGWTLVDTMGAASTASVSVTETTEGAKSFKIAISGTPSSSGSDCYLTKTISGLTPGAVVTFHCDVWENTENTGSVGLACGIEIDSAGSTGLGGGNGEPGSDPDTDPGTDPIPSPPPGGYLGSPGVRPFGAFNLPSAGLGYWNMTARWLTPSNVAPLLNAARDATAFVLVFFGAGERVWKTNVSGANGLFHYDLWEAAVDAIANNVAAKATMDARILDGSAFAHFLTDEPFQKGARYGGPIPLATIERMAAHSKSIWPTWPTMITCDPIDQAWYLTRHVVGLDWVSSDYMMVRGDCKTWRDRCLARLAAISHGAILAPHYRHINAVTNGRMITPSELRQYGGIIASTSDTIANFGWKYDSTMYNQPGFLEALQYVRDLYKSFD